MLPVPPGFTMYWKSGLATPPLSHIGLVWNPTVLAVIADRLSQRDGTWRPYAKTPTARRNMGIVDPLGAAFEPGGAD